MSTIFSGIEGAFYYIPAGTTAVFNQAAVSPAGNTINVGGNFNFRPGDPVQFTIRNIVTQVVGAGALPAPLAAATKYYVKTYDKLTGLLTLSDSSNLVTTVDISDAGTIAPPNKFQIYYADYAIIAEARDWALNISRSEIDVTKIGESLEKYIPFRQYISGFGDCDGTVNVYITDESNSMAGRILEDVLLRRQAGASLKLYVNRVESAGVVDDTISKFIEMGCSLISANIATNPDDGQSVQIAFRPSGPILPHLSVQALPTPPPPPVESDEFSFWNQWSEAYYAETLLS